MSNESVSFLFNAYGLESFSIDSLVSLIENHGGPYESKDEISSIQKLINLAISMAEKKGGETILYSIRFVDSATRSVRFSLLEGNVVRILEFSKAVILFCPDYEAKNTGMHCEFSFISSNSTNEVYFW